MHARMLRKQVSLVRATAMYLPPPRIELVGLLIEFVVEVYRPEVGENAPILRDEVPFDLNVLHRLAHDAADDVPHPQRLRYHLLCIVRVIYHYLIY